jgi:hypothetical protein
MPFMSFTRFLILALLMSSWPFSTPPSSRPMMTSTMAISMRVKPDCLLFMIVSPLGWLFGAETKAQLVP